MYFGGNLVMKVEFVDISNFIIKYFREFFFLFFMIISSKCEYRLLKGKY